MIRETVSHGKENVWRRESGDSDKEILSEKVQMDAVCQTEKAKDSYWQLMFRRDCWYEITFQDDLSKDIMVKAELLPSFNIFFCQN